MGISWGDIWVNLLVGVFKSNRPVFNHFWHDDSHSWIICFSGGLKSPTKRTYSNNYCSDWSNPSFYLRTYCTKATRGEKLVCSSCTAVEQSKAIFVRLKGWGSEPELFLTMKKKKVNHWPFRHFQHFQHSSWPTLKCRCLGSPNILGPQDHPSGHGPAELLPLRSLHPLQPGGTDHSQHAFDLWHLAFVAGRNHELFSTWRFEYSKKSEYVRI